MLCPICEKNEIVDFKRYCDDCSIELQLSALPFVVKDSDGSSTGDVILITRDTLSSEQLTTTSKKLVNLISFVLRIGYCYFPKYMLYNQLLDLLLPMLKGEITIKVGGVMDVVE